MAHKSPLRVAFAACTALTADGPANEIQLLPAGEFRAWDGRPADAPIWRLDAALAARLIDAVASRKTPLVIDYEHQTLRAEKNGLPAPAAGWCSKLEWREGVGLFAVDVEWTAAAAEMIRGGEYRYISPVIAYDKTGDVTGLYMASLTNRPAISGMDEVLLAAASAFFSSPNPTPEENMDELLEQLRWMLNLPVGATAEDVKAQLQKLIDQLNGGGTAAASFDLVAHLAGKEAAIAELTAKIGAAPDPAAFVPMAQFVGLQHECAALNAKLEGVERQTMLDGALADGRILPAHADYWRGQPLTALSAYLNQAKPIAALSGMQSEGVARPTGSTAALSAEATAVCAQLGISQDEYRKSLAA